MCKYFGFILLLISFKLSYCDLELKIFRISDEIYSVANEVVKERAGNNLTLSCELFSEGYQKYDDRIIWKKTSSTNRSYKNKTDLEHLARENSNELSPYVVKPSELNRVQLNLLPLRIEDEGTYFCSSLKFSLFKVIYIAVQKTFEQQAYKTNFLTNVDVRAENFYCNEKMFKCKSSGACITQHYVCDKKPDCTDGSDESYETCKGDPCKGKLQCDDGRCIPMYWCCDKHHDLECNVTYRPKCCQHLSEPYEELEYGYVPYNITQSRPNGTRYIFITLCISATFFSIILMLLIFSKVFIFAKKSTCNTTTTTTTAQQRQRQRGDLYQLEERAGLFHNNVPFNYRARNVLSNVRYAPSDGCTSALHGTVLQTTDGAVEALLILSDDIIRFGGGGDSGGDDRPPSYTDVMGQMEPPPPYTSQDCLNRI